VALAPRWNSLPRQEAEQVLSSPPERFAFDFLEYLRFQIAEPGARANEHGRHDPCCCTARASRARGSSLTFGKERSAHAANDRGKKKRLARSTGALAIGLSYLRMLAVPFTAIFVISAASGAAMSSGAPNTNQEGRAIADLMMIPPVFGAIASVVGISVSPGWKMRLAAAPAFICYLAGGIYLFSSLVHH